MSITETQRANRYKLLELVKTTRLGWCRSSLHLPTNMNVSEHHLVPNGSRHKTMTTTQDCFCTIGAWMETHRPDALKDVRLSTYSLSDKDFGEDFGTSDVVAFTDEVYKLHDKMQEPGWGPLVKPLEEMIERSLVGVTVVPD